MKKKSLKKLILNKLKTILETSQAANIKLFLVKVVEFDEELGSEENAQLTLRLKNFELIQFALVTSRISYSGDEEKKNYISFALVGIRSIIGYNPFLTNMINEVLNDPWSVLEVEEVGNDINLILSMFEKIERDLHFLIFSNPYNYLFLYDELQFLIYEHPEIYLSIVSIEDNAVNILQENLSYNILKNKQFNEVTVILAITSYFILGEKDLDLKKIAIFLRSRFPKQLKSIDLFLLFNLYPEVVKKVIKTWEE